MNAEQRKAVDEWLSTRPQSIKDLAAKIPMDKLYRIKSTGQLGRLYSYNENGTCTISVTQSLNPGLFMLFDRNVFGLKPEELEVVPCPDEN